LASHTIYDSDLRIYEHGLVLG